MADLDPRIRQFEQEAAKTLAAMKRSRVRAEQFERETSKSKGGGLEERARREVAKDRIRGETIGDTSASSAAKSQRALKGQSTATKEAAREQDRLLKQAERSRASEARLISQRRTHTRVITDMAEAERRYGSYAGRKYFERQATARKEQGLLTSREDAIRRYGPYAGERFLERQASAYYGAQPPLVGGGGAGGGGRRPPAPPGGAGGEPPGGPRFNAALEEEYKNLKRLEVQTASATRAHQRLIQVQASGSNVLRRHGALTTEFIQAAARGEVTIRELGYQTVATIGKFGGWITAGAAIYGALGAVQQMGAGALQAYSGVNQLQRVINGVDASKARREFSSLADYFQLPVGEVTQGVYEIGKVFHDQNTALEASKALLYSVRVGELDTATAGRYLIAITNAYNLSAKDLNNTFDKFNQLQNNFGVAIAGTESATARAAGSFVNAGGSLDYLIALIGTASRVTGAAPERVGTALQRAPSFVAKPKNQEELRAFGIDPTQDIEAIFEQAFRIAQQMSGKRRRELAAALFGPQYGAYIGTPLLQSQDVLRRIQDNLTKSKGSGARELARVKRSPEEQLKDIGIQLERLGAGLAESGLLSLLGGTILAIDDLLRLTNSLVAAFNDLPGPLKDSLGLMVQLGLAARLLGRLNVGEAIAPPGAQVGPGRTFLGAALGGGDRRDARLIRKGLFGERTALEDESAAIAGQARDAASKEVLAREKALGEQRRLLQLKQSAGDNQQAIAQSEAALAAHTEKADRSLAERLNLETDQEVKAQRLDEVNNSINRTRGKFLGFGLNAPALIDEAKRRSGAYPTSFTQPTTARPRVISGTEAAAAGGYSAVVPGGGAVASVNLLPEFDKQEKEMNRARQAAKRTATRLSGLRGSASRLGGAFNGLISGMGNLFFAAFVIGTVADLLFQQFDEASRRFEDLSTRIKKPGEEAGRLEQLARESVAGDSFAETVSDFFTHGGAYRQPAEALFGIDYETVGDERRAIARQAAITLRDARRLREQTRKQGGPVSFRYASQIQKDIERLKSGDVPARKARALLAQYREELAKSMEAQGLAGGNAKERSARLKAAYQALSQRRVESAGGGGLEAALEALSDDALKERFEAELTQAGQFGGLTANRIRRVRAAYNEAQSRFGGSRDTASIQKLAEARSQFFEGIEKVVTEELDHSLALARTPGARNAAYAKALQSVQRAFLGGTNRDIREQQRRVQNLKRQLRDTPRLQGGGLELDLGMFGLGDISFGKGTEQRLQKLRERLRAETNDLKGLRADRKQRREALRQIRDELRKQQYEENAALREAQTQLRVSRTADPLAQARIQLQAVNNELPHAIEVYGKSSKEVLELLQQRQEILAQQVQEQLNLIDARGGLRAAGLSGKGHEIDRARVELQTLNAKLAFMQANSNRFSPAEILQLQAEIRESQIGLAEQIEQEAEQLALAAIDVRIARAEAGGNDVRAARLQLVRARTELRQADTPLERREARATLIQRKAGLRDATAQQAMEDIEFQADIGKLTLDQQISAYQRILNTMKLTRDMRRDLRRRIYQLRHETENEGTFELNVGNIRLPTIYEIKRAVKGGVNGGGVTVQQNHTYNIKSTDPKGAASEVSRIYGRSNKAAMRSAGLR